MNKNECCQCGYCCTVRPCGWGKWDPAKNQCSFLQEDNKCEKYAEIVSEDGELQYPMFGSGCSSSLCNTRREQKIQDMKNEESKRSADSR